MSTEQLDAALLIGAAVLLVAVVAVRVSVGTGTPSLLLYLGLGLGIGDAGLGIPFTNYELTTVLGYSALVLILAEGGLTTRWPTIRSVIAPAAVLATLGTAVSVVVLGLVAHWLLDLPLAVALLLGAIVSSTDAAAVFSVLRRVALPKRVTGMLEAESGFNDAPAVLTVVALSASVAGGEQEPLWQLAAVAAGELAGGAALGLAVGWLGARGVRSVALPSPGLYPIAVTALCVLAYSGAAVLHLSGFLAVYLAALVLGNSRLPHRHSVASFSEGLGWLAQIGLFVLLGLLVDPTLLPGAVLPALAVGAVLLLLARPVSVLASLVWFRIPLREQVLLSWGGLRGAVPIVLATIPALSGVEGTEGLVELVFVLVVVFTIVQAPTLPALARALHLDVEVAEGLDVDSAPLGALDAEVLQVRIGPRSRLHGLAVFELRLPEGADVTLIVRDGTSLVPDARTRLRAGDDLLVVALARDHGAAERRLRALDEGGRLAQWGPTEGGRRSTAPPSG